MPTPSHDLGPTARHWLLQRARETLRAYFSRQPSEAGEVALEEPHDMPEEVEQLRGCFVTIHTQLGDLRGCIGTFEADQPLWKQVEDMALAAATRDPRFVPLREPELATCVLEISALTPRHTTKPDQIKVGEHGIWVQKGPHRGVLLPQVATSYKWDRETFLKQTCIKAGLAADAWRDGSVDISTFTAEVFTENEQQQ